MKIALLVLAALVPALASADDPKPYVLHDGIAVNTPPNAAAAGTTATKRTSAFGTSAIRAGISPGVAPAAATGTSGFRAARGSSRHRGVTGSAPTGGTGAGGGKSGGATTSSSAPPPFAVPGAKILTAGQQPIYSDPGPTGIQSVNGGGFIAIDQSRANDVGRGGGGISWAPPDTPPSTGGSGAGGNAVTANGPVGGSASSAGAPRTAGSGNRGAQGATGFDPSF
jgi:hypothetical protein